MLLDNKFVCLVLLPSILARLHVNLDLTNVVDPMDNETSWQYNCLHVPATRKDPNEPFQVISYCMNEYSLQWKIEENWLDRKFKFAEMIRMNITSQDLSLWSASIDLIEDYKDYMDQLYHGNNVTQSAQQVFYNCTSPRFGPLCQYSFDGYESSDFSLNEIISDFYTNQYDPTSLTCYMHLQCDRGSTMACLDWTDICNGRIECVNDAIDEQYCWQLEIKECADNEHRCRNGQCIPKLFYDDNRRLVLDCLDPSDEITFSLLSPLMEPTFAQEDVRCKITIWFRPFFTTSCIRKRNNLLVDAMFVDQPTPVPDECWFAYRCYFGIPNKLHPRCPEFCFDRLSCLMIINQSCPDVWFIPNGPVLFSHIYFAYTKQAALESRSWVLPPTYICYDEQLCDGFLPNKTLLILNDRTCRKPADFPVTFSTMGRDLWLETYVRPVYRDFSVCDTLFSNSHTICDSSRMYQCRNSSKCIPYHSLGDDIIDCNYGDDEQQTIINEICLASQSEIFFRCTITQRCIHQKRVANDHCDCDIDQYGLCEDEGFTLRQTRKHVSFSTTCDGFTDLFPVLINGQNHTDETECHLWPCNNIYARCDGGFWNCLNGADEINCDPIPFINCSQQHHICISLQTNQPMCLPLEKANDGHIDCLGATDEPHFCRSMTHLSSAENVYCPDRLSRSCTTPYNLCLNGIQHLEYPTAELCHQTDAFSLQFSSNGAGCAWINSDAQNFFYQRPKDTDRVLPKYFTLDINKNPISKSLAQKSNTRFQPRSSIVHHQRCHRGLPLRVWIDQTMNITNTTCLCPPSFYGDRCQYQNERVSLTVRFQTYSDSHRTLFTIVVSLIDDTYERVIHSHEQLSFLFVRDCHVKFNLYLLYSTRPKHPHKNYSIHVDFYDRTSLVYRGSSRIPIQFAFLPVNRIATILSIPSTSEDLDRCSNIQCVHGRCMKYAHVPQGTTFCHCNSGWSGRSCNISHTCHCSNDSLCVGVSAENRSICICPMHKSGSRCFLNNPNCQLHANETCLNGGQCIPLYEQVSLSNRTFFCMCRRGFTGDRCEILATTILLSFHLSIAVSQWMIVHFIRVMHAAPPQNGSTFVTISAQQKTATIYWTYPFHLAFLKLFNQTYYLIHVQKTSNASMTLIRSVQPSDRCPHISEVLNRSMADAHLLRRIKFYHFICQNTSMHLSCFYDDDHFCLCEQFDFQRQTNCFEFDHRKKLDCFGLNKCQNDAECVQDRLVCPQTSMCICRSCSYGRQCQFTSEGLGVSLDGILGYHIQPRVNIRHQSSIVKVSLALTIIMAIAGLVNNTLMLMIFKNKKSRDVGCGIYLLCSSISNLMTTIVFALKFTILIIAQIGHLTCRSFLYGQCVSIDFFLRTGLQLDQWCSACVALERTIMVIQGVKFKKVQSTYVAKYVCISLFLAINLSMIHDPLHRRLIIEDDQEEMKRSWCVVIYPLRFKNLNSYTILFHTFTPFVINVLAAITIVVTSVRRRTTRQDQSNIEHLVWQQIREHRHLFLSSIALVILVLPRLILSFVSGCMKSLDDSGLFLAGYYVSFMPSVLTFVAFVLPSKVYKDEFWRSLRQYRSKMVSMFQSNN